MIFSSIEFFIFFATLMLLIAVIKADDKRKHLLLIGSYIFYGSWNPYFLPLLIGNGVVGYYAGKLMVLRAKSQGEKKLYLWLAVAFCLGTLGYFKYANFFIENAASLFGVEDTSVLDIVLPVGISFFTFQTLSYVIDIYRDRIDLCRSLPTFLLYIAFFPQLVAGPIVRATEFLPQLHRPIRLRKENAILGLQIFLAGLVQKHLIADNLSVYVDVVFQDPLQYSTGSLWLGMFAYAMQIFCDFSGYSLMAIGCGRVLGFRLPTNFRMPYISSSITEFWHRWHITLSFWLRDYLYISLGGNRKGPAWTYVNLMITMFLGGLWHGASWNFVLWGCLHGGALIVHREFTRRFGEASTPGTLRKLLGLMLTLLFVCFTWIPFRADSFSTTWQYYAGLLGDSSGVLWLSPKVVVLLIVSVCWHVLYLKGARSVFGLPTFDLFKVKPLLGATSAILLLILFGPIDASPFIYFQF